MIDSALSAVISDPLFFLIGAVTVLAALGVVLETNVVRAGFLLVMCFGSIAGIYFLLKAPFVAASQILIYAVGITLVIVFGLMLTSFKQDMPKLKGETGKSIFSALIAIGVFYVLSFALVGGKWGVFDVPMLCPKNTEIIGISMLSSYVLPFELISVLLLVALIGAIVIAKKDKTSQG
jgi:NADH:ubiquinone oxidoreductase subunit 6 (subunit J)